MLDPPAAAPGADAIQKTGSEDVGDVGADGGDDEALAEQVRALERERRALAGEARRRVEEFIRRNAPRGDARGYTDEELARLNARRLSRAPFHPYGP